MIKFNTVKNWANNKGYEVVEDGFFNKLHIILDKENQNMFEVANRESGLYLTVIKNGVDTGAYNLSSQKMIVEYMEKEMATS